MKRAHKSVEERRPLVSRERDALAPDEKAAVAKILASELYRGADAPAQVLASGSLGGKDSAHDVFFVNAPGHPTGVVAVKRFRRPENVQHELEAIATAKQRHFNTLQPVGKGMYPLGEELGYAMVTARMPHFTTMNQIGWQNYYAGDPQYETVANTLQAIARFTGQTHRQGIIVHDRQLKNYAQTPPQKFVLFDLEGAEFFDPGSDEPAYHDGCVEDVQDLVSSLVSHGFLSASTDQLFKEELTTHVLTPYLDVNLSEQVLDKWDSIVDNALFERTIGGREHVGAAVGHLLTAEIQPQLTNA